MKAIEKLELDYRSKHLGRSLILRADCFDWFRRIPQNSIHAVVTDPPYGVKEYALEQLVKRKNNDGGIWRFPPSFDGHKRAPLPRFTALSQKEREILRRFFVDWARLVVDVLRPGGHVFISIYLV